MNVSRPYQAVGGSIPGTPPPSRPAGMGVPAPVPPTSAPLLGRPLPRRPRPEAGGGPGWAVPKQTISLRVRPGSAGAARPPATTANPGPRPATAAAAQSGSSRTSGGGGGGGGGNLMRPGPGVTAASPPLAGRGSWNLRTACEDLTLRLIDSDAEMWRARPDTESAEERTAQRGVGHFCSSAPKAAAAGGGGGRPAGSGAADKSLSTRKPAVPGQVCYGTNSWPDRSVVLYRSVVLRPGLLRHQLAQCAPATAAEHRVGGAGEPSIGSPEHELCGRPYQRGSDWWWWRRRRRPAQECPGGRVPVPAQRLWGLGAFYTTPRRTHRLRPAIAVRTTGRSTLAF